MAPNADIKSAKDVVSSANNMNSTTKEKALQIMNIRNSLPKEVFVKDLSKSMYYMIFDYAMWFGSVAWMYSLVHSEQWAGLPEYAKIAAYVAFVNVAGFFMWCLFVVGHDCGHGTFSEYEWLNDILGHIMHGSIMVPFYPWQLSHRRHHLYHNHEQKDYSHPWYTPEKMAQDDMWVYRLISKVPLFRALMPIYGWFYYLLWAPDGSHFFPFASQRMWAESDDNEKQKCIYSSLWVGVNMAIVWFMCGQNWESVMYYYAAPLVVFGWWLTCVTYLQHHAEDTLVYTDNNWKFVDAAFQTVDRTYGAPVDNLSHNITDGHVVHHLFFTKIPHYNLSTATKALQGYMKDNGINHMYKHEETRDFAWRLHKYFYTIGFGATRCTDGDDIATKKIN